MMVRVLVRVRPQKHPMFMGLCSLVRVFRGVGLPALLVLVLPCPSPRHLIPFLILILPAHSFACPHSSKLSNHVARAVTHVSSWHICAATDSIIVPYCRVHTIHSPLGLFHKHLERNVLRHGASPGIP